MSAMEAIMKMSFEEFEYRLMFEILPIVNRRPAKKSDIKTPPRLEREITGMHYKFAHWAYNNRALLKNYNEKELFERSPYKHQHDWMTEQMLYHESNYYGIHPEDDNQGYPLETAWVDQSLEQNNHYNQNAWVDERLEENYYYNPSAWVDQQLEEMCYFGEDSINWMYDANSASWVDERLEQMYLEDGTYEDAFMEQQINEGTFMWMMPQPQYIAIPITGYIMDMNQLASNSRDFADFSVMV